jgi:hypothetical protein
MYGHGFGTLFLAEASGMVQDPQFRERLHDTLGRAVRVIVDSQKDGGWRYTPDMNDADISVTVCQMMALRAARNAGVVVPKSVVDGCVKYVLSLQTQAGYFKYQMRERGGNYRPFARTAAGVSALYSAAVYEKHRDEIQRGLDYLLEHKNENRTKTGRDLFYFYGHYYAVQAMWTAGGKYWDEWFPTIRDELVSKQIKSNGCWEDICNHYGTAMACIILQVPNGYLPIFQK